MKHDILLATIPVLGYTYIVSRFYIQFKKGEYNPEKVRPGDSLIGLSPAIPLRLIHSLFIKNIMLLILLGLMIFSTSIDFRFYKLSGKIKYFILSSTISILIILLLFNSL